MRIFIDTEFTDFLNIDLIALGAITDDGIEFYAERSDFDPGTCNHIVHENILPLLGRNPGRVFSRNQLASELANWLCGLPGDLVVVFDYIADLELFVAALADAPTELRTKVEHRMQPYALAASVLENTDFKLARDAAYVGGLMRHHALDDAKALRIAYLITTNSHP